MKKYLLTGCCGFIGSNFIHYMLKKYTDIEIYNIDALTYAGNLANLNDITKDTRYHFIKGDIGNKKLVDKLFNENDFDYVINFAAESHVDRSIKNPEIFVKTNIMGTVNLLNIAKKYWLIDKKFKKGKKFLQISTDEVYGSLGQTGLFNENTPLNPHSPYSASKTSADVLVSAYFDTYKMPVNITRCSNNYGEYQFPEKLIPLCFNNAKNLTNIPVYGDGNQIRDWLYVIDHCKAIDLVLHNAQDGEIYNIGGNNERTNICIVQLIIDYVQKNITPSCNDNLIKHVQDRLGHDKRYGIDASKIKKDLGWFPETTFETGIIKTLNWYKDNQDWCNHITSGDYAKYYKKMYEDKGI